MSETWQWVVCIAAGLAAVYYILRHYGVLSGAGKGQGGHCSKCETVSRMAQMLGTLEADNANKH